MGEEGRHFLHNVGKMYKLFIFHMQVEECDGCFWKKKNGSLLPSGVIYVTDRMVPFSS